MGKTVIKLTIFGIWLIGLVSERVAAQTSGINYQAVAIDMSRTDGFGRNVNGKVLSNKELMVRFIIREESEDGPPVFEEVHQTTTDPFGVFRLLIGGGELNGLGHLNWNYQTYFLEVAIDLGDGAGFTILGIEQLVVPPYSMDGDDQTLSLIGNELIISDGNSVLLEDLDSTNELIEEVSLDGTILRIADAGGTREVDIAAAVGDEAQLLDEIQDLQLNGNELTLSNDPTPDVIDLSVYLDDTNTQLSEAQVDAFVTNNGYLTAEVDGSTSNELQDLQLIGNTLSLSSDPTPSAIDLSVYLDGAFSTDSNVTSNAPGDIANDDFVFGSDELEDVAGTDDDSRILFDKSNGSFRAGVAEGIQWDSRGAYSIAFGRNTQAILTASSAFGHGTTASGSYSTAMGHNTTASNTAATSLGFTTVASGLYATAIGASSVASGAASIAAGASPDALGDNSIAIGWQTIADSYASNAFGAWNLGGGDPANWVPTDPLFEIGNGTDPANRSNALTILKNGNTTLNGTLTIDGDNVGGSDGYTFPAQDGTANQVMVTDGNGAVSWGNAVGSGAFSTTGNITSNAQGDLVNDDFVFGSDQLDDDPGSTDDDVRMLFDKSTGAFRVGTSLMSNWDEPNRRIGSIAMGTNVYATNFYGVSIGTNSVSSGNSAVTIGTASGSSGDYAYALGYQLNAPGINEIVLGKFNTIYMPVTPNGNPDQADLFDRLFVVGNGTGTLERSDALIMLNNGNTTLNGTLTIDGDNVGGSDGYTLPAQDGTADQVMITDGNGIVSWENAAGSGAFSTTGNITSNAPGDLANDDFVFGSNQLDDDGNSSHDSRMFFEKSTGVIRAGFVDGTQWDTRGNYSVAFGENTIASEESAMAAGSNSEASGISAMALGHYVTASGTSSNALGFSTIAHSYVSTAVGRYNLDGPGISNSVSWVDEDPIFMVGNGSSNAARHNALTILKDGSAEFEGLNLNASMEVQIRLESDDIRLESATATSIEGSTHLEGPVTIGQTHYAPSANSYTLPAQDGAGNQLMMTNGLGAVFWMDLMAVPDFSDQRLKKNIQPLKNSLAKLNAVSGVNYQWNSLRAADTTELQVGVIAQEVQTMFPELVNEGADGYLSVEYMGLIPYLIEAVKELKSENEVLKAELNELRVEEQRYKDLNSRLAKLEALLNGTKSGQEMPKTFNK